MGNIYRLPKFNNSYSTIENCIQEITPMISRESPYIILTGDFDINLLEIDSQVKCQAYFDLLVNNGFNPKIVQPSRFSKKKVL